MSCTEEVIYVAFERHLVQILVVVASFQLRRLNAEVEMVSM